MDPPVAVGQVILSSGKEIPKAGRAVSQVPKEPYG